MRVNKRFFDILFSFFFLVILAIPLLIISLMIFLETFQSPLFIQSRNGQNQKRFKMYKFKTMKVAEDGINDFKQATEDDRRITFTGKYLRRSSLDELPQLFNIFIGNMSVVGPRPHPIALDEKFKNKISNYMLRYDVKPGLTGLAQIHGFRGETDTVEKMILRINKDLEYVNGNYSLFKDLLIIFSTFKVFFKGQ